MFGREGRPLQISRRSASGVSHLISAVRDQAGGIEAREEEGRGQLGGGGCGHKILNCSPPTSH